MRRKYSNQFKGECIEMYVGLGMTSNEISKRMGVSPCLVLNWVSTLWFGKAQLRYGHVRTLEMEVRQWT